MIYSQWEPKRNAPRHWRDRKVIQRSRSQLTEMIGSGVIRAGATINGRIFARVQFLSGLTNAMRWLRMEKLP